MLTSLLLDREPSSLQSLENKIKKHCPNLIVSGTSYCMSTAQVLMEMEKPDLIFLDIETGAAADFNWDAVNMAQQTNIVFLSKEENRTLDVMRKFSIEYLEKPVHKDELINVVEKIERKVFKNRSPIITDTTLSSVSTSIQNDLIGVPTMEGYDFIPASRIVRCEGLQKCTRVITLDRTDIVSSYHLGVFKKMLHPFGFFSSHKSFLINLSLIKKYHKEGTITMTDGATVPLARRKRTEFLNAIRRVN